MPPPMAVPFFSVYDQVSLLGTDLIRSNSEDTSRLEETPRM